MLECITVDETNIDEIVSRNLEREFDAFEEIDRAVQTILEDVKKNGDQALFDYSKTFDGVNLTSLKVSKREKEEALQQVSMEELKLLQKASDNIRRFHEKQVEKTWIDDNEDGKILGQLIRPIDRVGLYVPGGKAIYPSSVFMNAIPAKVAGVSKIVMVTPPDRSGNIHPFTLAAAQIAGVDEIYKIGGAQAIGALAFGTESVRPVDKIVGPGNIYVARAKRMVFGYVDIDMVAGPSEICIIADEGANAKFVAADLLSQAEHDENASAILITTSPTLAKNVRQQLIEQLDELERKEIASASIQNNGKLWIVDNLDVAFQLANAIAPEHLELMISEPMAHLSKVRHAGAVFLGEYSPEPLGDYFAGPNHTLPTNGTARFSSPLGVYDFVKKTSLIFYDRKQLCQVQQDIAELARMEGFTGHAKSIEVRFEKTDGHLRKGEDDAKIGNQTANE
ncbi:histidinol dehydrogenase [Fervidibacillus albus]|uniref:Histidinol dehydrogenase n=1 Tax=Fervidibacillus albus TaxID=2980026 RepID=A0A9E8RX72_9BACI|nr:histidinol dehydrogenase [Fervidibacillus albus]WAA10979.1 histidinol dehydrogenase [Fervidibacillus albus]